MKDFWNKSYQLIDSGEGEKLERFGDKILMRPSTVALWKKRNKNWSYDAKWDPKKSWIFTKNKFDSFVVDLGIAKLEIRLQSNGQIGLFPEHATYLTKLKEVIKQDDNLLNLFAYTGMASNYALSLGANVTHVDVLKKCLDWMQVNQKLNQLQDKNLRLVPEDALVYLRREAKREKKYEIVIADPPSFYRGNDHRVWNLEENFHQLMSLIIPVIKKDGYLFISCHSFSLEVFNNLILDYPEFEILETRNLLLEDDSSRKLPAGVLAICRLK